MLEPPTMVWAWTAAVVTEAKARARNRAVERGGKEIIGSLGASRPQTKRYALTHSPFYGFFQQI